MKTVRIISTGGTGRGTSITADTGESFPGIESVSIDRFGRNDVVRVNLTIGMAQIDVKGTPTFLVVDPRSGEPVKVAAIHFADGNALVCGNPWQPIETAKRDGTHLLLLTADFGPVEGWWDASVPNFYKSQKGWASYDPDNAQGDWVSDWRMGDARERRLFCGATPKFWMALPAEPSCD